MTEFIVMPDMRNVHDINPDIIIGRLHDLGATAVSYRCFFVEPNMQSSSYFRRFLDHIDSNNMGIYLELKDTWWLNKSYPFTQQTELQSLLDSHKIKGLIIDDYVSGIPYFKWLADLDFSGNIYGTIYSHPDNYELNSFPSVDSNVVLDGFIDFVHANSQEGVLVHKDYRRGLSQWKASFPDMKSFAGFHCSLDEVIIDENQLSRSLEEAKQESPDGYLFWLLDWGDERKDWQHTSTSLNNKRTSKYNTVKHFIENH